MITREELLRTTEYWLGTIQFDLYAQLENYLRENNMSKTELAEKLGVSKGYVSQLLNGDFDHRISKLVALSLAIGKVPILKFESLEKTIAKDKLKTTAPLKVKRKRAGFSERVISRKTRSKVSA